jgi:hypothetical protein
MAATGYTPIQLYYSTSTGIVPTSSNLIPGELAINVADGKLFYKDNAGSVQTLVNAGGAATGNITTVGVNTNTSYFLTFVDSNNASPLYESVYTTSSFTINPTTGNIGISTGSALTKLHVFSSTPVGSTSIPAGTDLLIDSGASSYITFRQTSDAGLYAGLQFTDNNAGGYIVFRNYNGTTNSDSLFYGTYQDHVFQNQAGGSVGTKTETVRITQAGNVGINNSAPNSSGRLVVGNTAVTSATSESIVLVTSKAFFSVTADGATNAAGTNILYSFASGGNGPLKFSNSSGEVMRLDATGNVAINSGTTNARLLVFAPNTTAPSLTFGAAAGQIFRNESAEFAFGLSSVSPFPLYIQGRYNNNTSRDIAINPLGGALYAGGSIYSSATIYSNNLLLQGDNTNAYVRPINAGSFLYLGAANSNYLSIGPTGVVTALATTAATSTATGALQVLGGLGVGGRIYASGMNIISTNTDANTFGNIPFDIQGAWMRIGDATSGFTASNGIGIKFHDAGNAHYSIGSTGTNFVISQTSTNGNQLFPASRTDILTLSSAGIVTVNSTSNATSTVSGALQVLGGVGIGGNLYVGGDIVANRLTIQLTTITTTQVTTDDIISTYNSTNATSTASGALQITGGAGIGRDLWVGGTIYGTFSGGVAGTSTNATALAVVATATNAAYFPTFVDSNNSTLGNELFYTTSSFAINPSTGFVGLGIASPTSPLYVRHSNNAFLSSLLINNINTGSSSQSRFELLTDSQSAIFYQGSVAAGGGWGLYGSGPRSFFLATNAINRLTADGTTGVITINSTSNATSTASGALQVLGGVGVGGSLWAGNIAVTSGGSLNLRTGNPNTTINQVQASFDWISGGYKHFLISQHNSGAPLGNNLQFYMNTGTTSGVSTAPGVGNTLTMYLDASRTSISTFNGEQFRVADNGATAVNYVQVTGAATSGIPTISAQGSDADIDIGITAKGNDSVRLSNGNGLAARFYGGINSLTLGGSGAGVPPELSVFGSDTNIDLKFATKGTGRVLVTAANAATSTATGGLVVYGGQGIGGALFVGSNTAVLGNLSVGTTSTTNKFEVAGTYGQLFSVTDSSTGTIFSANDISGIPSIEVLDTGLVKLAQYNGQVTVGTSTAISGALLSVNGGGFFTGTVTATNFVGAFSGTFTGVITTASSVAVVTRNTNATHYLTFVDSDNAASANELLYTTGSVVVNPVLGTVGIGTTLPQAKLSVGTGSLNDSILPVQISTPGATGQIYYGANKNGGYGALFGYDNTAYGGATVRNVVATGVSGDAISFVVNNNTEVMRMSGNGQLGINITPPTTSTTSKLHLGGDLTLVGSNRSMLGNLYFDSTWRYAANGYGWGWRENAAGVVQFANAPNNTAGAGSAATVSLTNLVNLDIVNGRVGLGTATPASFLTVAGQAQFNGNAYIFGNFGGGTTTTTYNSQLKFDLSFNDVARGPNKVELYNSAWLGGFGVHTNTLGVYSGGVTNFYQGATAYNSVGTLALSVTATHVTSLVRHWVNVGSADTSMRAAGLTVAISLAGNFTPGFDPGDALRNTTLMTVGGGTRPVILGFRNVGNDALSMWDLVSDPNTGRFYIQASNGSIGYAAMSIGTTGTVVIGTTTNTLSTTSGALVVNGGVGIARDLRVGGTIFGSYSGTISGTATNALSVATIAVNTNSTYFPTFVDSNNATSLQEVLYTTSSFSVNAATGFVGLGTTPGVRLDVSGDIRSNGFRTAQVVCNLGATINAVTEIGNWSIANGAHNLHITVTASISGYSVSKNYLLSSQFVSPTTGWSTVGPLSNPGPFNSEDFALEARQDLSTLFLRLRKTVGSVYGGNYYVTMLNMGEPTDAFTPTSATGTTSTASPLLSSTPIFVSAGNVGIGTSTATYALTIVNSSPILSVGTVANTGGSVYLGNSNHGVNRGGASGSNDVSLYTTSGNLYLSANGLATTSHLTVLNNGNVGIGINNPSSRLYIQTVSTGTDGMAIHSTAGGGNVSLRPNMGSGNNNGIVQSGDSGIIYSSAAGIGTGAFVIAPWNNTICGIRLDANGIVRIVTPTAASSTASGALQVTGGAGIGGNLYVGGTLFITSTTPSTNTTTGALVVAGGVGIGGALNATTKSFNISHPTKPGMQLRYGSLEGPEFGVYVRGRLTGNNEILLPDYWSKLVDPATLSVELTPIGKYQKLYVAEVVGAEKIIVGNDNLFGKAVDCFYTVYGERADVDKLQVEG